MNILLLEDRGSVTYYLSEALEKKGHTVHEAYNINDAKSLWEDNKESINCIIADLNMETDGLLPGKKEKTMGGVISGWIWLEDFLEENSQMKSRVIVYSAYLKYLYLYFNENKIKKEVDYKGIIFIDKHDDVLDSVSELLKNVEKIKNLK
jgi:CheY-like chemotaxis protein